MSFPAEAGSNVSVFQKKRKLNNQIKSDQNIVNSEYQNNSRVEIGSKIKTFKLKYVEKYSKIL